MTPPHGPASNRGATNAREREAHRIELQKRIARLIRVNSPEALGRLRAACSEYLPIARNEIEREAYTAMLRRAEAQAAAAVVPPTVESPAPGAIWVHGDLLGRQLLAGQGGATWSTLDDLRYAGRTLRRFVGQPVAKRDVKERVLIPTKNPLIAKSFDQVIPRIVAVTGPPSTGKRFVVECLSAELGRPIVTVDVRQIAASAPSRIDEVLDAVSAKTTELGSCVLLFADVDAPAASADPIERGNGRQISKAIVQLIEQPYAKMRSALGDALIALSWSDGTAVHSDLRDSEAFEARASTSEFAPSALAEFADAYVQSGSIRLESGEWQEAIDAVARLPKRPLNGEELREALRFAVEGAESRGPTPWIGLDAIVRGIEFIVDRGEHPARDGVVAGGVRHGDRAKQR